LRYFHVSETPVERDLGLKSAVGPIPQIVYRRVRDGRPERRKSASRRAHRTGRLANARFLTGTPLSRSREKCDTLADYLVSGGNAAFSSGQGVAAGGSGMMCTLSPSARLTGG